MTTFHVLPPHGPSHTTDGSDCWCVASSEPVLRADGSVGFVVTHSNFVPWTGRDRPTQANADTPKPAKARP